MGRRLILCINDTPDGTTDEKIFFGNDVTPEKAGVVWYPDFMWSVYRPTPEWAMQDVIEKISASFDANDTDMFIFIGSAVMFSLFRANHREKLIQISSIRYLTKDGELIELKLDDDGKLEYWPPTLFSMYGKSLDRLL